MSNSKNSKPESLAEKIFGTVFFTLLGVGVATAELALVVRVEDLDRTFILFAMGGASVFWCIPATAGWLGVIRDGEKNFVGFSCFFSLVALVSVAGIFIPQLNLVARWINVIFGVMMLSVCVQAVYEGWNGKRPFLPKNEQDDQVATPEDVEVR